MAEDHNGTSLAWFLVGAALGAAGALLLAPQSGSETRESLRRRTLDGRERLSKSGREAYDKGRELYDRGREVAGGCGRAVREGTKSGEREVFSRELGIARRRGGGAEASRLGKPSLVWRG